MPEINNLLRVEHLRISYSNLTTPAVSDLSFQANGGSVLGILGGNGAGKTSTLKAIAGILPPSGGEIILNDYHLTNPKEADAARQKIGYCPDIGGLIKQATVLEHIGLLKSVRKSEFPSADVINGLIESMGLANHSSIPVGSFSHGMARRLSVLLAFLSARELLILDEPFDGVDPLGVETTLELITEAKGRGLVVVVSTHLLTLLSQASDEILVMNKGQQLALSQASDFYGEQGAAFYKSLLMSDSQLGD